MVCPIKRETAMAGDRLTEAFVVSFLGRKIIGFYNAILRQNIKFIRKFEC